MKNDNIEAVLGKPVMLETTENGQKIRRNLLITSLIAIFMTIGDIHINSSPTIFGLQFTGLTDRVFSWGLVSTTIYLFIHFLWYSIDGYLEWATRLTGTHQAFYSNGPSENQDADYSIDPRQSTIYNWWRKQRTDIDSMALMYQKLMANLDASAQMIQAMSHDGNEAILANGQTIAELKHVGNRCQASLDRIERILNNPRLNASIQRFDNRFKLFLNSQNLRWLLIESSLPLASGMLSIYLLLDKLNWIEYLKAL